MFFIVKLLSLSTKQLFVVWFENNLKPYKFVIAVFNYTVRCTVVFVTWNALSFLPFFVQYIFCTWMRLQKLRFIQHMHPASTFQAVNTRFSTSTNIFKPFSLCLVSRVHVLGTQDFQSTKKTFTSVNADRKISCVKHNF